MNEEEKKKPLNVKKELISWAKVFAAALVLALLITNFLVVNASIDSGSMENTVMTGDRVICNRLSYLGSGPERFDIVFFKFPYGKEPVNYLKRVIGLPGEKVEIIDGMVYIDDSTEPLADYFVSDIPEGYYGPYYVPEDNYFMMGDNRNASYDSKDWPSPFIPKGNILGKAIFVYYPEFRILPKVEE